jgi:hypothetical protein
VRTLVVVAVVATILTLAVVYYPLTLTVAAYAAYLWWRRGKRRAG